MNCLTWREHTASQIARRPRCRHEGRESQDDSRHVFTRQPIASAAVHAMTITVKDLIRSESPAGSKGTKQSV